MSRFHVPKDAVKDSHILVEGEEAHHIVDVMRLKVGDDVVAFDGTGREYAGVIDGIKRKTVSIKIVKTRESVSGDAIAITLIQAVPKKEKMDYIVEKATELGIHAIMPVFTKRAVPDWDEAKRISAAERWRKIAKEAAKQCGRADIPQVSHIEDFEDLMKNVPAYDLALIATLAGSTLQLKEVIKGFKGKKLAVAIGPEGDFTRQEVELARMAGFKAVSLGRRVLKSDTAALAAAAILNYEFTG